jgi:hypothetical protein
LVTRPIAIRTFPSRAFYDKHAPAGNGFQLLHVPERFMMLWGKLVKKITTDSSAVKLQVQPCA